MTMFWLPRAADNSVLRVASNFEQFVRERAQCSMRTPYSAGQKGIS
jgi:hypothetical protein